MSEETQAADSILKQARRVHKVAGRAHTRKHGVDTVNRNQLAQYLDKLWDDGGTVIGLNISLGIGGSYEVVYYKEVSI